MKEGVLDLLMRVWSGERIVGKNGVQVKGLWFGQYNTELMGLQGRKVRVSYDPDDLRQVYVYDAESWRFITIAEQAKLIAYGRVGEKDLREATGYGAEDGAGTRTAAGDALPRADAF